MNNNSNQNNQSQSASTERGNINQYGRDYIHTSNTKISIWISVILIAVLAIGASVLLNLDFGDFFKFKGKTEITPQSTLIQQSSR
ncbi:hypothetical protein [Mastigocoleus sp. MO_188.B34]|uniref:hypothetical protein n=1 Tax=Mastigocoleus sp. MO_188.B34 TaxID=3036635 RepID=UPI00262554FF|nr:hypothetical protein [Mastigocoleus sp. MO_188.B34]MDJ0697690.1 hypothetical protein [Mastigocoleus sp. MO_188.B34]